MRQTWTLVLTRSLRLQHRFLLSAELQTLQRVTFHSCSPSAARFTRLDARTGSLSAELASTGLSWRYTGAQRGTVKEPDGAQIHTRGKAAERSVNVKSWRRALVWGFFFVFLQICTNKRSCALINLFQPPHHHFLEKMRP